MKQIRRPTQRWLRLRGLRPIRIQRTIKSAGHVEMLGDGSFVRYLDSSRTERTPAPHARPQGEG